ncbi:MAG: peptidase M48, Ste24p [Candidatus Berkelbacteria bacterium Licking1014_7]|uniref:Peptidase M48, Ste24p n=1 Tax=Candidatus Berkelbacteria bacterium Licking1014_7 TaxID=2017147 RepID=A0A554LK59_9BACT|nr:MAG: peptidase M48, Ste24p [Candidatus Berkelbacteria bacterium Licking1014_7]
MRQSKSLLVVMFFVLGLGVQSVFAGGLMLVSEKDEIQIGKQVALNAEREYGGVLNDFGSQARLDRVAKQILQFRQRQNIPYEFKIINNDEMINAFACPGGPTYITKKLLDMCETDGKIAFIVGHEVAHTELSHGRKAINNALITSVAAGLLLKGSSDTIQLGAGIAFQLLQSGYSRDQERDADTSGVRLMVKAGYNPQDAIGALEMLGGGKLKGLSKYFASHPATSERVGRVKQQIATELIATESLGAPQDVLRGKTPRVVALEITSTWAPENLDQIVSSLGANYTDIKFVVWGENFQRTTHAQDQVQRSGRYDTTQPQTPAAGKMTPPSEIWFLAFSAWDSERAKGAGFGNYRERVGWGSRTYTAFCEIVVSPTRIETGEYQKGGASIRGEAKSTERRFYVNLPRLPGWGYSGESRFDWQAVQRESVSRAIQKTLDWIARQDPVDPVATARLAERQQQARNDSRQPTREYWLALDQDVTTAQGARWRIQDTNDRLVAVVTITRVGWDASRQKWLAYYTLPSSVSVPDGLRAYPER